MASFCRRHSYRGGKTPAELLARLQSAPTAPVGIPAATLAILVGAQVQLLRTLLGTIAELDVAIAKRVVLHPRAKLLASLPGVGIINLAQLLAEVGPVLDRVANAEQAAAECGAAPVTRASGKTSGVYFRWAANRRARKALTAFAHTLACSRPGPDACTPTPAPAVSATRTRPGSSPVLGCGSSGPAGTPAPHTIPALTSPSSAS